MTEKKEPMNHSDRVLRSRMGAYAQHAKYDTRETTTNAREAFLSSFEKQVDPDGILEPRERARRAEAAKKAHMTRLSYLAAQARRKAT